MDGERDNQSPRASPSALRKGNGESEEQHPSKKLAKRIKQMQTELPENSATSFKYEIMKRKKSVKRFSPKKNANVSFPPSCIAYSQEVPALTHPEGNVEP